MALKTQVWPAIHDKYKELEGRNHLSNKFAEWRLLRQEAIYKFQLHIDFKPTGTRKPIQQISGMTVHDVAKTGFGIGTNELYDKARPSYPAEALAALYHHIWKSGDDKLNILELGSGTGIFTRAILGDPLFGPAIGELKAVEPSEGMREVFSKKIQDPRVSTHEGTFDCTGVEAGWADVVLIAQAWHWCPDYGTAMAEISRSLKPHGVAAFIWNLEDREAARWVQELRNAYEQFEAGTPQYRLGLWRRSFETDEYKTNFDPPLEEQWKRSIQATEDSAIDRVLSKSYISILSDENKENIVAGLREILTRGSGKIWVDEAGGVFEYPYQTDLVVMKKQHSAVIS